MCISVIFFTYCVLNTDSKHSFLNKEKKNIKEKKTKKLIHRFVNFFDNSQFAFSTTTVQQLLHYTKCYVYIIYIMRKKQNKGIQNTPRCTEIFKYQK